MLETRLVYKNEYRFDLRKVESVLFPLIFFNEPKLIIKIQPKSKLTKNYQKAGVINQSLIDYPGRIIGLSKEILLYDSYQIDFPQQGRFQLEFNPYSFLGKTQISISRIVDVEPENFEFQPT